MIRSVILAVRPVRLALPALLFLLSGFSALIYQVAWLRMLGLVFGVTVYAASAVLSSFMGGLALGAWAGGRLADRFGSHLRAFAVLEIGIALSALATPSALEVVSALYAALHASAPDNLAQLTAARVLSSGLILLVPTTLMGASLPLLARHVSAGQHVTAGRIGLLYAANTAGGILGATLAGFTLIGGIGLTATTRVAAAVNIGVGLMALIMGRSGAASSGSPLDAAPAVAAGTGGPTVVLIVMALAGFAGLALEVVWFRLLTLFLTATTYAFTTMLATVLAGIALGSAIAAARVRHSPDAARTLAWIQIATGMLVLLSITALAHTYRLGWRTSGMVQACMLAMLPATTLMGATFPYALAVWLGDSEASIGRRVGALYAVNVAGAVAGALLGGFVLLPWLGSRGSLVVLAAVYGVSGCLLLGGLGGGRALIRPGPVAAALFAVCALTLPDPYTAVLARRYPAGHRLVFREEGVQTTATVHYAGRRSLYLDGLHQANDSDVMVRVHAEIGHLPMMLHAGPKRALVVGLGGGVTAGAVARHAGTATDVVELAQSVVAAATHFSHVNGDVLTRPNVTMRVDDARNYLKLTAHRYDVVTADLIQPGHAGAGNLYSLEYFQLARGVLRPDGVMLQWIGHRDATQYKLIMRTFLRAFPDATLWADGTLMAGTVGPLRLSRESYERRLRDADLLFALRGVGLDTFDALLARYTAGPDEMRRFVGEGPVLTDDRPVLEYHRSLPADGRPLDLSSLRGDVEPHLDK